MCKWMYENSNKGDKTQWANIDNILCPTTRLRLKSQMKSKDKSPYSPPRQDVQTGIGKRELFNTKNNFSLHLKRSFNIFS